MTNLRTSLTDPIRFDELPIAAGVLGLTFCPGKHGSSLTGRGWARDLELDLAASRVWGASELVTLMDSEEFTLLNVPDLPFRVTTHGMAWRHLPIPDQGVPADAFMQDWPIACQELLSALQTGARIVLHCRGGLGRTGLVAALLLIETGIAPEDAIREVRRRRPRAIETRAQEDFVRTYRGA